MNKNTLFFAFCKKYGFSPSYQTKDVEVLRKKICASDFFIADDTCTHRMVGFFFRMGTEERPKITFVCTRNEMPLARKIALDNRKKIYYNSKVSAILFRKYYEGSQLDLEDSILLVPFYVKFFRHRRNYFK